ncbi:DNA-binding response regulator [Paenibacillus baekrokdamisoli]|uniref:DNA-binding response regulator n=1 Tax=Paenibacillus baekrokdamisoli TaxID=1712516 RepID=A0A3G9J6U1_9BACL|nr:response regulator [Paenibacillus baekrokdamisoli]MBB3067764.1 two-component system response regulator YesN [Paenibacillus baekrokdamisoli]BBH19054.1 DNA-binding response regulator [Paenibacillus baekrokdamisoli]
MQMIIVDDEAHWVDNLAMHKPWHKLGIEQVHKAYSAHEALQILETHPIDIVISDIIMPEMTGIELIERIRIRDKKIKCIILSGHSDFEYTKEALRNQAVDYLLKPPTDDELFGAVKAAIDQLNTEWENISSYERTQYTLRENLPLLRGQLLLDGLHGHRMPADEWSRKLTNYGLPFSNGDCALLLVRMEEDFEQYKNNGQQLMEYAIVNMAEEIIGEFTEVWGVKEEHGYLVFLLQLKEDCSDIGKETILEKLAIQLQYKVKQFLKGSLSIVMTEWFRFPEKLADRYLKALAYFRQIVGEEREFVMRVGELAQNDSHGTLDVIHMPPTLINLLEAGRWDSAEEKLVTVFAELDDKWSESLEHCMEAGFLIASSFAHLAHRNGHTLSNLLGPDIEPMQSGEAFSSINKLRKWSISVLGKLKEGASNEIKDIRLLYVQKIQEFVEKNLHDDVSLRKLADHVNLHPTHLSKIYKIETGEGISNYVSALRMDRACHLLKTTDKKVYEISIEIGYLDPAYFIKVFKRQFGVTPQEYRDGINNLTESYEN